MAKKNHLPEAEAEAEAGTKTDGTETKTDVNTETTVAELTADLQRLQAEFINYKRRVEDERAELMTVDVAWAASIDAIRNQFDRSLRDLGVERFLSVGRPFDPNRHEAVADIGGSGEYEIVAEELQAGYLLGDRVLRPAMVRVAHTDETPVRAEPPAA